MDLATVQAESQLDLGLQQGGDTNSAPEPGSGWTEYLASPGYTLLAGMLCGVIVNFITRHVPRGPRRPLTVPSVPLLSKLTGDYKMVLVVRSDLGMQKGKAAAQCAHAALGCYKKALKADADALAAWERTGQTKVCVKVDGEEALLGLAAKCRELGITWSIVRDAGRTQVEAGSLTVLGVGPADSSLVDSVTGNLKLY